MKKKKKVSMSVKTIVCVIFILLGAFFAVKWGTDWRDAYHPATLSGLSAEGIHNGMYITCDISEIVSYRLYESEVRNTANFSGAILYEYDYYVVPLYDGNYIEIAVYDLDVLDTLDSYVNGKGQPVSFLGKVGKKHVSYNSVFYQAAGISKNNVITGLEIMQETPTVAQNKCLIAIAVVVASIIGFANSFKVVYLEEEILNNITTDENPDGTRTRVYNKKNTLREQLESRKNLNLDYELKIATRRIERLQQRLASMKREAIFGAGCVAVGGLLIYVFIRNSFALVGILLALFGLSLIWKAFLNSGNTIAVTFSEIFAIDTLYRQIKHTEAQKAEIETMMMEKAQNDFKVVNALGRSVDKPTIIDSADYADAFMIKIESDKLYQIVNGEEKTYLKINTDELLREEQFIQWGNKTKDISAVLNKANRDIFFIHFGDVDALWMVANNIDYSVAPVSVVKLFANGNITVDNIVTGLIYNEGEILNPQHLMLRKSIECFGTVVATSEYHLNNLAKPELTDSGDLYYYVDDEYVDDEITLGIGRPLRAWVVPVMEQDIDASVCDENVYEIPAGTKCNRLRIPRRASHTYVDASLDDGRIIRFMEGKNTGGDSDRKRLVDAAGDIVAYKVKEVVLR